jgi:hypothetical protein
LKILPKYFLHALVHILHSFQSTPRHSKYSKLRRTSHQLQRSHDKVLRYGNDLRK